MDLLESVGSADASCSDTGWTKDMISKMMSSEPPKPAFNGDSRYLTSLWVFGNREDLSRSELPQSAFTSGGMSFILIFNSFSTKNLSASQFANLRPQSFPF